MPTRGVPRVRGGAVLNRRGGQRDRRPRPDPRRRCLPDPTRHAPEVERRRLGGTEPSASPLARPYAGAARRALRRGVGRDPLDVPLLAGRLPDAVWAKILGLPSFLVPYADHDEANHAPNQSIELDRFFAGVRGAASLLAEPAAPA